MADGPHPYRQYAGFALVLVAYVGGIIGWSCAVLNVSSPSTSDADPAQASPPVFMRTTLEDQESPPSSGRQTFSHAQFDRVLQMNVEAEGTAKYEARQGRGNPTSGLLSLQRLDAVRLAPSDQRVHCVRADADRHSRSRHEHPPPRRSHRRQRSVSASRRAGNRYGTDPQRARTRLRANISSPPGYFRP